MIGLFIGRFQPFHNGHLEAVKWMLKKCDEVIILVGSSQFCYEKENPFTVGERIEMITSSLKAAGLWQKCQVLFLPDVQNNALWVVHVNSLIPNYDLVYSNNPLTRTLFEESGKKVESIPFHDRENCDGTKIRNIMGSGRGWERYMPAAAVEVVKRVKGPERLKSIGKGDKFEDVEEEE
ncbi:nicotinamide-nucleotide adenylyltransferase [Candidatus Micrarchaeota archaeon]|nr:MAG: nicotinamide-nucleotide adenylyltransferase [Candidatus Micrarchaeota archaeon]